MKTFEEAWLDSQLDIEMLRAQIVCIQSRCPHVQQVETYPLRCVVCEKILEPNDEE